MFKIDKYIPMFFGSIIIVVFLVLGSVYKIDAGERGVLLTNGKVSGIADPGLGFKLPIFQSVQKISTRATKFKDDTVFSYTKDQQPADMKVSVVYAIDPNGVESLYKNFQTEENFANTVLKPNLRKAIKDTFGKFTAVDVVQHRSEFSQAAFKTLRDDLAQWSFADLKSLQVENIDFSDAYEQTIEDKMKAEVEVSKYRQNLEREKVQAQILVTKAKADAEAIKLNAQAKAEALKLQAQAEADALHIKGQALRQNPNMLELSKIEKWNGVLPSTMLPNSVTPMLNVVGK